MVQVGIETVVAQQLLMGTLLHQASLLQHVDIIGHLHGRKAVADQHGAPSTHQLAKLVKQFGFRLWVECAARFIEHDNAGLAKKCAGDGDFLPLADAVIVPAGEGGAQQTVVAVRQAWMNASAPAAWAARVISAASAARGVAQGDFSRAVKK